MDETMLKNISKALWEMVVLTLVTNSMGFSQIKDSLTQIMEEVDTVLVREGLPLYILHTVSKQNKPATNYESPHVMTNIEIRRLKDPTLVQVIRDSTDVGLGGVKIFDINLDGYADIQLNYNSWDLNHENSIFLFKKESGTYYYSRPYSEITNATINTNDSVILSSEYYGNHGEESRYYKVVDGLPVLIKRELESEDSSLTAKLIDGKMIVLEQVTFEPAQIESCKGCVKVLHKKMVYGSLLATKEEILRPLNIEPSSKQRSNGLYRADFRGRFLLRQVFTFTYGKDEHGRRYRTVTRQEAVEDALKVIDEKREYLN
jgi:hypothetical protein